MGIIILARMEETGSRQTGRIIQRDRNLYPEMESYMEPHALLWCRKELRHDLESAMTFAADNGYIVCNEFPKGTRVDKAIELAKASVEKKGT